MRINRGLFIILFFLASFAGLPYESRAEYACNPGNPIDLTSHITSQIDSRLDVTTPSVGLDIYLNRGTGRYEDAPTAANPWKRNLNSWTQKDVPLNFTGVSGWNDDASNRVQGENHVHWSPYTGGATLITPRHFVTANHFAIYPGSTVVFFNADGKPISRKVVDSVVAGGFSWLKDINVGLLDSDVDSDIAYYPIVEKNELISMLQGNTPRNFSIPIVVFNQKGQAMVRQTTTIGMGMSTMIYGKKSGYTGNIVGGDSGQPVFIVMDNKPVLISTNMTDDGSLINYGDFIDKIDSAITLLNQKNGVSGNYAVTKYRSSCFIKYPILRPDMSLNKDSGRVGDEVIITVTNYDNQYPNSKPSVILLRSDKTTVIVDENSRTLLVDNKMTFKVPNTEPGLYSVGFGSIPASAFKPFRVLEPAQLDDTEEPSDTTPPTEDPPPETTPPPENLPPPTDDVVVLTAPGVQTIGSSNALMNSIVLIGSVSTTGGGTITSRGFQYGISSRYDSSVSESGSFGTGRFILGVTNLYCDSVYTFRAFARNSAGTTYGTGQTFSTAPCPVYDDLSEGPHAEPESSQPSIGQVQLQNNVNVRPTIQTNNYVPNPTIYQDNKNIMPSISSGKNIVRNLKLGDKGDDVKTLQFILNSMGYSVAESGPGSPGSEAVVFDKNTEKALMKYQGDFIDTGIKPTGELDNATLIYINSDLVKLRKIGDEINASSSTGVADNKPTSSLSVFLKDVFQDMKMVLGIIIDFVMP